MKDKLIHTFLMFTLVPVLLAAQPCGASGSPQPGTAASSNEREALQDVDPFSKDESPRNSAVQDPFSGGSRAASGPQLSPDGLFVCEIFTLPKMDAYGLLSKHLSGREMRDKLVTATNAKGAALEKLIMIRTRSGQRAKVEQIDEFPYAHEFYSPQVPQTLTLGGRTGDVISAPSDTNAAPDAPNAVHQRRSPSNAGLGTITTSTPTEFEIRNLGTSLEIDPVFGDDGTTIAANISMQIVGYLGETDLGPAKKPIIESRNVNTMVTCALGQPCFVGTLSRTVKSGVNNETADDTVSLAFFTVFRNRITPVTKVHKNPPKLTAQWTLISLEKSAAAGLFSGYQGDDLALHAQVSEQLAKNAAQMERVMALKTRSGQRSKVEQTNEFFYWTSISPPQMPATLSISDPGVLAALISGQPMGAYDPASQGTKGNAGFGIITSPMGGSCEARNLGEALEIDPVLGEDGVTVEVNVAPECVRLASQMDFQGVKMPVFETQKLTTAVTLRLNEPRLLGTMSRPVNTGAPGGNKEDRVWLAFLTVSDEE